MRIADKIYEIILRVLNNHVRTIAKLLKVLVFDFVTDHKYLALMTILKSG